MNDEDVKKENDEKTAAMVKHLASKIEPVLVANHVQHSTVLAREIATAIIAPPTPPVAVDPMSAVEQQQPAAQNSVAPTNSVVEGVDKTSTN